MYIKRTCFVEFHSFIFFSVQNIFDCPSLYTVNKKSDQAKVAIFYYAMLDLPRKNSEILKLKVYPPPFFCIFEPGVTFKFSKGQHRLIGLKF
jgi:hypothetical protein